MWLTKEIKNEKVTLLINPNFFDFSKTSYPNGIPLFGKIFNINNEKDKYDLDNSIVFFEEVMKVGFEELLLLAKEEGRSVNDLITDFFNTSPNYAFVKSIGVIDTKLKKMEMKLIFSNPFIDLIKNERLGSTILVTNFVFKYNEKEEIYKNIKELNKLFFKLFIAYINYKNL